MSSPNWSCKIHAFCIKTANLVAIVVLLEEETFARITSGNIGVTLLHTVLNGSFVIVRRTIYGVCTTSSTIRATSISQVNLLVNRAWVHKVSLVVDFVTSTIAINLFMTILICNQVLHLIRREIAIFVIIEFGEEQHGFSERRRTTIFAIVLTSASPHVNYITYVHIVSQIFHFKINCITFCTLRYVAKLFVTNARLCRIIVWSCGLVVT